MNTRENLKEAFAGESQANRTYLAYGERAQKDGFAQVAELFRAVAAGEDLVDTPIRVCPVCGHTVIGDAPDECPLCKAKGARFQEIPITVVTVDAGEACTKPMLSNALARKHQADDMVQKEAASIAADLGIEIRSRTRVLAIDLDDYSRGRSQSGQSGRVLTIGGGLIGCEFANDLAVAGFEVAIVDPAPWPDCVRARSAVCWSLPALPVVVKTPALPLVVCPPPAGTSGAWELEPGDGEAAAIFRSEDGAEAGFALAGGKTRVLLQMAKRMPPLLPAAGSASRTLAMLFTSSRKTIIRRHLKGSVARTRVDPVSAALTASKGLPNINLKLWKSDLIKKGVSTHSKVISTSCVITRACKASCCWPVTTTASPNNPWTPFFNR